MEPNTQQDEQGTRSVKTVLIELERAGAALEKAGKKRNGAIASAIGGSLLAGGLAYFEDPAAYEIGAIVRIAAVVLAVVLFVQANGHEIAVGRMLKGQRHVGQQLDLGMFSWLGRWK